jgi:outer membrane protein assembly factor BamB
LLLAASLERAVTQTAELLLGAGALLAIAWGLLRTRIGLVRWALLSLAVVSLGVGTVLGAWDWHEKRARNIRGSTTDVLPVQPTPKKPSRANLIDEPWPTYGHDAQRTHLAPQWRLRPPFHALWRLPAGGEIEYPPSIAYGRVYLASQKGRFFVVDARTGNRIWTKHFSRCSPSSPTIADGIVYQAFMHPLPCQYHLPGASGFVIAWDARNGRELWRFDAGAVESSPLVVDHTLYFGSWDSRLYALALRGRKRPRLRWTFKADDQVVAAPAYAQGTVYLATSSGSVYALDARTGRVRWHATSFSRFGSREYFYATPTVAYGRVFAGNADGTVYAFGASNGRLLWARQVGTYVYTAPAVWKKMVYVGTWDGFFVGLDAQTGDIRWRFDAKSSITGAPTVLDGLVYFSTCGRCGEGGVRLVRIGRRGTFALNARTGQVVWKFFDGHYSPVVADSKRIYIVGRTQVYAFMSQVRWLKLMKAQAAKRRALKRPAGGQPRHP